MEYTPWMQPTTLSRSQRVSRSRGLKRHKVSTELSFNTFHNEYPILLYNCQQTSIGEVTAQHVLAHIQPAGFRATMI